MAIVNASASSAISAGSTVVITTVRARSLLDTISIVSSSVASRVRQAAATTAIAITSLSPRIIEVSVTTVVPITQNDEAPSNHPTVQDTINIIQDLNISPKAGKSETLIPLESTIVLGQPITRSILENIQIVQSTKTSPAIANVIDIIPIDHAVGTVAPRYVSIETIIPIVQDLSSGGSSHKASAATVIIVGSYANRIKQGIASSSITFTQAAVKVKWDIPSTAIAINQSVAFNTSKYANTVIPISQVARGNNAYKPQVSTVIPLVSLGVGYVE